MPMRQAPLTPEAQAALDAVEDIDSIAAKELCIMGVTDDEDEDTGKKAVCLVGIREDNVPVAIVFTKRSEAETYAHGLLMAAEEVFGDEPPEKMDA